MTMIHQFTRNRIPMLTIMMCTLAASAAQATSHDRAEADVRDLAALLLFNGEHGAKAYDTSGPIGDADAVWSRETLGRYTFVTTRPGVMVRGLKSVAVKAGCTVRVETQYMWLFAAKPAETLERVEQFDFRMPVVADAVLALEDDKPFAVILDMRSGDGFYCKATRINGVAVEPSQCAPSVQAVVGPGLEDSPVLKRFQQFSRACKPANGKG
jgi:hypothetical protein